MSEDLTPYRTRRESNDLAVIAIAVFGVVGGLVRLATGSGLASVLAGMVAWRAVVLIADQVAMRRGVELVTGLEASKREARELASLPIWLVCLQTIPTFGSVIIILNLLTMREADFYALPFIVAALLCWVAFGA